MFDVANPPDYSVQMAAAAQALVDELNAILSANQNWKILPQPNGQLLSAFPTGSIPPTAPSIATIPNIGPKSAAFSIDLSAYVTNAYTSLQIVGSLPSGWTFGASLLSYNGLGVGTASVQLQANWAGAPALSNVFSVQGLGSVFNDATAPTIPVAVSVSLNSTFNPVVTFLSSMDPVVAGYAHSGMKDYLVYRAPAASPTTFTQVGSVSAPTPGLALTMVAGDIGSPAVAGSTTQTGTGFAISGGGTDYFNSADQGQFCGAQVTGNFIASMQITAASYPQAFSAIGIDARVNIAGANASGSPHVFAAVCQAQMQLDVRTSQGGSTTAAGNGGTTGGGTLPVAVMLQSAAGVFTQSQSTDGNTFSSFASDAVTLPAQVYLGIVAAAKQAASSATATIANFAVTQDGFLTFTDTSLTQGASAQSFVYAVAARDVSLNASVKSLSVPVTIPGKGTGAGAITIGSGATAGKFLYNGVPARLFGVNVAGMTYNNNAAANMFANNSSIPLVTVSGFGVPVWSGYRNWFPKTLTTRIPAFRIFPSEASWLGLRTVNGNGVAVPMDPHGTYKTEFTNLVNQITATGAVAILCCYETAPALYTPVVQNFALDADHAITFWTSLANAFKGNPLVIFEPLNETQLQIYNGTRSDYIFSSLPNGANYCICNGGGIASHYPQNIGGTVTLTAYTWTQVGFQQIITAIRGTGATNPICLGGQQYNADLSWVSSNPPTDPLGAVGAGAQLALSWHIYNSYEYNFLTSQAPSLNAAGYAILCTEIGPYDKDSPIAAFTFLNSIGGSWCAWSLNPWSASSTGGMGGVNFSAGIVSVNGQLAYMPLAGPSATVYQAGVNNNPTSDALPGP